MLARQAAPLIAWSSIRVLVSSMARLAHALVPSGKVFAGMLYQGSGSDPIVFLAAPAILSAVSLLAGYVPARRCRPDDRPSLRVKWGILRYRGDLSRFTRPYHVEVVVVANPSILQICGCPVSSSLSDTCE
jgi:hypothetical protein